MTPAPWLSVVLALGVFRLMRLVGWDDLPPLVALRDRLTGAQWRVSTTAAPLAPGVPGGSWSYRRPLLAKFITCPWCVGFWIGLAVYAAWLADATATMYGMFPLALNAAVGLIAKRLDP